MTATTFNSFAPPLATWVSGVTFLVLVTVVGLIGLVLAFVGLSRTRWGQASPLAKCTALALYAHLLFLCYAYGTMMVFDKPTRGRSDSILKLNLLAGELAPPNSSHDSPPNMDKPAEEAVQVPDLVVPSSAKIEQASTPSAAAEAIAITQAKPPDAIAAVEPPRPIAPDLIALDKKSELPATTLQADDAEAAKKKAALETPPLPPVNQPPEPSPVVPQPLANLTTPSPTAPDSPPTSKTRTADGEPVPHIYQHRSVEERSRWALLFGGSQDTEAAVNSALDWLAANQAPDGRWDAAAHGAGRETKVLGQDRGGAGAKADTGVSGLALLAFLAAGETHLAGPHRESVQHGLEFLLRSQRSDGCMAGQAELFASMYCHGMATLALAESYAMTGDNRIRPYLERAIQYTLDSQNGTTGGWRYQPGDQGDMSQFGWQLMALKSAEQSGLTIPARTREGMTRFLSSVTSGTQRGLASYRAGERPTRTMTAEALACRFFLNDVTPAAMNEAVGFVYQELPRANNENLYYWYYGTLALFQTQGDAWKKWNAALQEQLLSRQRLDGKFVGSWDPDLVWGHYGGRIYSTAMGALCLEVYYRYLPLYGAEVQTARRKE